MANYQNPQQYSQGLPQYPQQPYPYPNQGYGPPQQPYYQPYHQAMAPPRQQVARPLPTRHNPDLNYKVGSLGERKVINLFKVKNPAAISVTSKTVKLTKEPPTTNGKMTFSFIPDGNKHLVNITDNTFNAFSFSLKPHNPSVTFPKEGGSKLTISNLYNPKSLRLASDRKIEWSLKKVEGTPHAYTLNFDAKNQVQNIRLTTLSNNVKVPLTNGNIRLAPKTAKLAPKAAVAPQSQPMMHPPQGVQQGVPQGVPQGVSPVMPQRMMAAQQGYYPQVPMQYYSNPQVYPQGPVYPQGGQYYNNAPIYAQQPPQGKK